ncbi:MAG TPA: hypothetical protein PK112_02625 [candidate division Zixibacteria bacterium]|nr:hypothetical protein [candidate division Zixibacteria bacterium]
MASRISCHAPSSVAGKSSIPATDDGAPGITTAEDHRRLSGPLLESVRDADAFRLRLAGRLAGEYVLRPVTIDGERRHLFYRCT